MNPTLHIEPDILTGDIANDHIQRAQSIRRHRTSISHSRTYWLWQICESSRRFLLIHCLTMFRTRPKKARNLKSATKQTRGGVPNLQVASNHHHNTDSQRPPTLSVRGPIRRILSNLTLR